MVASASPVNGRRMNVFMGSGALVSANSIAGSTVSSQKGKASVGTRSSPRADALPGSDRSQSVQRFGSVPAWTLATGRAG